METLRPQQDGRICSLSWFLVVHAHYPPMNVVEQMSCPLLVEAAVP
jgi:hypothetical protein